MERFIGRDTLEFLVRIAPILNRLFPMDVFVAVGDTETIRAYQAGQSFDIGLKAGDRIKQGTSRWTKSHAGKKSRNLRGPQRGLGGGV